MNTFGPINWREYYRPSKNAQPSPPVPHKIKAPPCSGCNLNANCVKSADPDAPKRCQNFIDWFRYAWPIVTGRKKAAHPVVETE